MKNITLKYTAVPWLAVSAGCLLLTACGSDSKNNFVPPGSSSSSSIASSSSSQASSEPASLWTLVWSDEFDGNNLDREKWSFEKNCWGGGNNELQCYIESDRNAYVADGKLHIVALKESTDGPSLNEEDPGYPGASVTRDYSSARLRSKGSGDWTYGRIEINARLPQGQGIWPAFWMLPSENRYGGWPLSGEIDILEAVNLNTPGFENTVHGTLHYGQVWPNNQYTGTEYSPPQNTWEVFHTYAVEWQEGEIRWYVDDVHFATQTSDGWFTYYWDGDEKGFTTGSPAAPFDQNFHLLLNLAVGGNWPGSPNAETVFPQTLEIDYVRVYQCSLDPETGKGCATSINPDVTPLPGVPAPQQKEISLYKDGPQTLEFSIQGGPVSNTLQPAHWDNGSDNVSVSFADSWNVAFAGLPGNAFLSSGDMSAVDGVKNGFKLTNMASNGELKFDIFVESIDPQTELHIKLDSGWPNVSYVAIDTPAVGAWTPVSIALHQLQPNNVESGAVDFAHVLNPFVIEPFNGKASVRLNNIRFVCAGICSIDPVLEGVTSVLDQTFSIYEQGGVGPNWDFGIGSWDNNSGHVQVSRVDVAVRGEVIDVRFGSVAGQNGLMFIQSTTPKNATAFMDGGYLEFDIKVIDYGASNQTLIVKAESGPSTGTADIALTPAPTVGEWQTIRMDIREMVEHEGTNSAFNLAAFNTPFVFLPAWDNQAGVHVQLDNIRWVK